MIIKPPLLTPGDRVAIIPPAKAIDFSYIREAEKILMNWGLEPVLSDNIRNRYFQFAGTDTIRRKALQKILDDPSIRAIFSARGGYGTTRIIDDIDFTRFLEAPKWIIGYSDITVLLNKLYALDVVGIHGPMPLNFGEENAGESLERLRAFLFEGRFEKIRFGFHKKNREGRSRGPLVGGNLSMLVNCLGTATDLPTDGRILFLEEIDEHKYHIDRMLVQLKRSGKLKGLKGLVIGQFTRVRDNEDPFGMEVHDMVMDLTADYAYPVCMGAPIGHEMPNFPIPVGMETELDVNSQASVLSLIQ